MDADQTLELQIPADLAGQRLDQALAGLLPEYSRARLQKWIGAGQVLVDGQRWRPRDKVSGGEQVRVTVSLEPQTRAVAQDIPLAPVYQDEHLIVIDKPAGLVVHPAAGNPDGTLQNALLHHFPELGNIPRAGIVHRLDKDTSGLMVVARSLVAHASLVDQLQQRTMGREYEAVVSGAMVAGGTVDAPIGRHPVDRKRMAVVRNGKPAVTHYRVLERFAAHTHIRVKLETGRTHQIRVHMAHIRYPIVGDPVYGGRLRLPPNASPALVEVLRRFSRQALHARQLCLRHPATGDEMCWESDLPVDIAGLLQALREATDAR